MINKTIFILPFFLNLPAMAKKTDGQFQVVLNDKKIEVTTSQGFHLNEQAPAFIEFDASKNKINPESKKQEKFVFAVKENFQRARLNFYVCDDAKTVCEQQAAVLQSAGLAALKKNVLSVKEKKLSANKDSKSNKVKADINTLYVFSAPWCPACIRLHSETLNQNDVVSEIQKSTKIKEINIDLIENIGLADHFGVKAIPTMILTNAKGEEVYRWLDFQQADKFKKEFISEKKSSHSIETYMKQVESTDSKKASAAALALAMNSYNKLDYEQAVKWFEKSKSESHKKYYYSALVELAKAQKEDKNNDESLKKLNDTLLDATAKTDSVFDQARWSVDFIEVNAEADAEKVVKSSVRELKQKIQKDFYDNPQLNLLVAESTVGDISLFEKAEILDMQLRLSMILSDASQIKKERTDLKNELSAMTIDLEKPGQVISAIYYLGQAGEYDQSNELYKKLIAKYSATYVYYQKYANFLLKQKKYSEALDQINKALEYSEGNLPQLNTVKIKVLKALGKNTDALALIEETLLLTKPYTQKYKRTISQLETLKKEVK